jgi:hypothetical protein
VGDERRVYYVVRPVGDRWELSFADGSEPGVLFLTASAALITADELARRHWERRHEPSGVRVEPGVGAPRFGARYGNVDDDFPTTHAAHAP